MKKLRFYIKSSFRLTLFVGALFLYSCSSYKVLNIQTLRPAPLDFPSYHERPVVLIGLYKGVHGVQESIARAAIDSTAAHEAAFSLIDQLHQSPLFTEGQIPIVVHYKDDFSKTIEPLSWGVVDSVSVSHNADVVIALDYMHLTPKHDAYSYWDGSLRAYYGYLTYTVYAYWRVYSPSQQSIQLAHLHQDTLTWEEYDYLPIRLGQQLPKLFEASAYSGFAAGADFAARIAPSWVDEQRIYFSSGSSEMKKATKFVEQNLWFDASAQWQKVLQAKEAGSKLHAKAAFNLAVANEILGNFELAEQWLEKSKEYHLLTEADWYLKIIQYRVELAKQL